MTVTPSTSDVADKAVSTDDGSGGMEVARLEAVLAALVETKVEAIKASSSLSKRSGSVPATPRKFRLTSISTASSSLNHHYCQYRRKDQQHHHHYHQYNLHHGKARRRASESPRCAKKAHKYSKGSNVFHDVVHDIRTGRDSRFELLGMDANQDLALTNFERTRETLSDSYECPQLHRSACYFSQSTAQFKIHYDDDDYVALNIADELEDEEALSGPEKIVEPRQKYHRPRRKRKQKLHRVTKTGPQEECVDPHELPPRARWVIVATACLLLVMSLLLVGVTLRMAPIIDDMVRKENEELLNSLNKDFPPENSTALS